ncbi:MAG: DUF4432 family protein [Caldilineaceae bacterium]
MFDQPYPTQSYLHTYGGFLIHCGATRMGVPGPEDDHPLHGELPNAAYQQAWIVLGEDEGGAYIGLSGRFRYTVAFAHNYVAQPTVKIYTGSTLCHVGLEIQNLKQTPMELMYLAHANFRPVDNGRLLYSAYQGRRTCARAPQYPVAREAGAGLQGIPRPLGEHPEQHHVLAPDLVFDPEIVFNIDYLADVDGLGAHAANPPRRQRRLHPSPARSARRGRALDQPHPRSGRVGAALQATAGARRLQRRKSQRQHQNYPCAGTSWRCDYVLESGGGRRCGGYCCSN